ncbi:hypothetical protein [Novosphingobium sp. ZW T3_23]|uniref:hypothetical protein n=1 Tax=Novosphingobium sp. ZW T3_23 TaxID=3378084 RepID=UPI003852584A
MTRKTRRVLLGGAALLLAAGNVWWFTQRSTQPEPDFVLGTTYQYASIPAEDSPALPRYDAIKGSWVEKGHPINAISDRIRPYRGSDVLGPWVPTSYLAIGVETTAGPDQLYPIFVDLVRAGVCDVAVVPDGTTPAPRGEIDVMIQHIVSVRDGKGAVLKCAPAQRAAAPSSASR